jgi:DNA-binding transcriptional regulator YdaS (Cro superfamily)
LDTQSVIKGITQRLLTKHYAGANITAMNLKEWSQQSRGRQKSLACFLGIRPPSVCDWVSGKKSPSIKVAAAIEEFTEGQVTRKDLFPNDWQRIWPELADQSSANQVA